MTKYRRKVVDINLSQAFPTYSQEEKDQVAKDYYKYLADVICEIIWGISKTSEYIIKKGFLRVDNIEILSDTFTKYGNVVVLMPHTGNWELFSALPACAPKSSFKYENVTVAYHKMSSQLSEILFKMVRGTRLKKEGNLVTSDKMLRFILENKGARKIFFFISDQYPWKNGVVSTNFMNCPTLWVNGGEAIARKLNIPVVYSSLDRISRGKYVARFSMISENPADTAPGEIMTRFSDLLEKEIIDNNYNWLWSHKRWKNIDGLYK